MDTSEEHKTYWKKVPLLDNFFKEMLKYNREKIHKIFSQQIDYTNHKTILDIGTTPVLDNAHNFILQKTRDNNNITCLSDQDLQILKKKFPNIKEFIKGDGKKLEFNDNAFDIVHASATIEHVGSYNNQLSFIKECFRVAKEYAFLTTPNRYYPLDFHTKLPFLHWLPKTIHRKILKNIGFEFYSLENNLNLLSKKEIINLVKELKIKEYSIIKMNFMLFCSNLILVIKK